MHIFSLSHTGFGINTNILETNIINLAVVLYFLTYLKDTYVQILKRRTIRIISEMWISDKKYEQALLAIREAKIEYIQAKVKVVRIRSKGRKILKLVALRFLKKHKEQRARILRLKVKKIRAIQTRSYFYVQSVTITKIFSPIKAMCQKHLENDMKMQKVWALKALKKCAISSLDKKKSGFRK